eukprot:TRINITY_DN8079_c0_g1_i3.p1 TRINITY_DN8079_c0_g1~~TRINITY_DN8079_c0_g1_i3.p1  ORF type:complete len:104 (+),score=18.40 TRINITY_DN8079_c0_g1_i3:176-487(+)
MLKLQRASRRKSAPYKLLSRELASAILELLPVENAQTPASLAKEIRAIQVAVSDLQVAASAAPAAHRTPTSPESLLEAALRAVVRRLPPHNSQRADRRLLCPC